MGLRVPTSESIRLRQIQQVQDKTKDRQNHRLRYGRLRISGRDADGRRCTVGDGTFAEGENASLRCFPGRMASGTHELDDSLRDNSPNPAGTAT